MSSPSVAYHAPVEIVPGLFIGNRFTSLNLSTLLAHGITHIVNAGAELGNHFPSMFQYYNIPLHDMNDSLSILLPPALQFIHNALNRGGKVLVHCNMGISRSSSTILAYMMLVYNWTLPQALLIMKQRYPKARPNPYYINQLQQFVNWRTSTITNGSPMPTPVITSMFY
jgi:protein-tyrosine phosphatase